jgi:predicted lipid-binding transport protein (Tim44 family)
MGDGYYLDIILFALVAAFLVLRLRSVLGRRDGFQGKNDNRLPFPGRGERGDEQPARLPELGEGSPDPAPGDEPATMPASLDAGLTQIRVADPSFDEKEFIVGAQKAFELILQAFANEDVRSLQPLLSQDVYNNFVQTIRARQQAGEKLETTLVGVKSAEIVEAYMTGRTAHITVKFVSEQISAVRDANSEIIEGDATGVNEVVDCWTFARDTRSSNPNWTLVATGAPD